MLKLLSVTISILCMSVAGCADFRTQFSSLLHSSAPPPKSWDIGQSEILPQEERDSYFREYAPWRVANGRLKPPPPLRRSLIPPEATGSNLLPEQAPEDIEEFQQWLELRREQAQRAHDAQMARFSEMDTQALRSICAGC
jgi:hypothetical protein